MTIAWLVYVSQSRIPADTDLSEMVAHAQRFNAGAGLTGSLVFTGTRFAQCLEGPAAALDALMDLIGADPRHSDLVVVGRGETAARRFADWSMAYAGSSMFVGRTIDNALSEEPAPGCPQTQALIRLMQAFAQAGMRAAG
jgi:hypothetical protein